MSAGADIDRLSTQKKTSSHLLAWNLLFVWFRDSCDTNFRPWSQESRSANIPVRGGARGSEVWDHPLA